MTPPLFPALLPDVIVAVGAMLLLLWGAAHRDDDAASARRVAGGAIGTCVVALIAIVAVARGAFGSLAPNALLAADNFRWSIDAVILIGTALSAALAADDRQRAPHADAFGLMLLAASGMMLLAGARDLILVFLGIELMSIPIYVLAGIDRRSARSAEAALKYFLLGAFSTAFLLYGIALVYGATGATDVATIAARIVGETQTGNGALPASIPALGAAFMLVGFGFKVAAAPFHMWTPDVYEGAPTPYTAFMAAGVKAGAFAAFARVFLEAFRPNAVAWHPVVWWIAAFTMVAGNLIALAQRDVKRMLAYSSIAHAGYLLVALVSLTANGSSAIVFYLFAYTLATVGAFAVVQAVGGSTGSRIEQWYGLYAVRPRLAIAMAVFMLALLGFPLAGGMGFFAKWFVVQAALSGFQPQWRLVIVLVVSSVISAGYYLYLVGVMFMRRRDESAEAIAAPSRWTGAVIAVTAVALLVLGIYPQPAVSAARQSAVQPAPLILPNGGASPPVAATAFDAR